MLGSLPGRTKHVVEGMGEGIGRIRREIGRVRSPKVRAISGGEYDGEGEMVFLPEEEEEDQFEGLLGDVEEGDGGEGASGSGSGASMSISTPATLATRPELGVDDHPAPVHSNITTSSNTKGPNNNAATDDSNTLWDAWDDEARATIAEAEMFDDISATGFLDEEAERVRNLQRRMREREEEGRWGAGGESGEEVRVRVEEGETVETPIPVAHEHEPIMKAMSAAAVPSTGGGGGGGSKKGGKKRGKGWK